MTFLLASIFVWLNRSFFFVAQYILLFLYPLFHLPKFRRNFCCRKTSQKQIYCCFTENTSIMPLLACVDTFSEQLHFRRIYFFTVGTSSEQLVLHSNQFNTTVTFVKQLFLQSCHFFGIATFSDLSLLLSSYFFQNTNFF